MIRFLFAALFAVLLPSAAFANDLEGTWALQIEETVIFRFDIDRSEDGEWRGTWTRPDSFASNGAVFMRMEGSEELVSMAGLDFAGDVELSFDDPRPGAVPDIFRFRHIGDGQVQLTYVGTELPPYPLVAVAPGTPLGPFHEGRVYDRDNAITIPTYQAGGQSRADGAGDVRPTEDETALTASAGDGALPATADLALPPLDEVPQDDAPQGQWQPDASVRAAVAARAAGLEAGGQPSEDGPSDPPEPERESLLGDDFLDDL